MKRAFLGCALLLTFTGSVLASSSGLYIGASLHTYYNRSAAPYCGQPLSDPIWTDSRHIHQQFARCELRGSYRILTPTAVAPTPRPTLRPSPTTIPTIVPPPTPTVIPSATPVPSNDPAQQLLALLNEHRTSYGSAPLTLISDATTAKHAAYMSSDGTIWHTSALHPDASFPYDSFAGENVGAGQSVQQVDQAMWAEGVTTCSLGTVSHACNIVNGRFTQVAIGLAYGTLFGYPAVYLVEDLR